MSELTNKANAFPKPQDFRRCFNEIAEHARRPNQFNDYTGTTNESMGEYADKLKFAVESHIAALEAQNEALTKRVEELENMLSKCVDDLEDMHDEGYMLPCTGCAYCKATIPDAKKLLPCKPAEQEVD